MIYLFPTCLGMVLWCVKQVDSGYSCSWGRGDVVHCLDIPALLSASLRFTIWYQLPSVCDGSDGRGANGNKDALFLFFVIRTLQSVSHLPPPPGGVPATRHPPYSGHWHKSPHYYTLSQNCVSYCPAEKSANGSMKPGFLQPAIIWSGPAYKKLSNNFNSPLVPGGWHARIRRETCCWCWCHYRDTLYPVRPPLAAPVPAPSSQPSLLCPLQQRRSESLQSEFVRKRCKFVPASANINHAIEL